MVGGPLNPGSIATIFRRVAQWIGMPERFVDRVSVASRPSIDSDTTSAMR